MKKNLFYIIIVLFLYLPLWGEEPIVIKTLAYSHSHHQYYIQLLEESFKLTGKEVVFELYEDIPHLRAAHMLDTNQLSLCWFLETEERSSRWKPVSIGLTGGLIGHRVFFIGRGKQYKFDNIYTLQDFQDSELTGVLGINWFDTKVWDYNNLKYHSVIGAWKNIYTMMASGDRKIDYFSRGVTEILSEAKDYPMVDIEKHLLFIYDRDFIFYMSDDFAREHGRALEEALQKAREAGLIEHLASQFWSEDLERLDYNNRTKIYLENPR